MTASILFRASSLGVSLACVLSAFGATGCSSSIATSPNSTQSGDDSDTGIPSDAGSKEDATIESGDGGQGGGDDASSPHDGSSPQDGGAPEDSGSNAIAAGDAGAAEFCAAVCMGLSQCAPDGGPCHCSPGSAALERTDFVATFISCVQSAIVADCTDAGSAVENCQVTAAAAVTPTVAAAAFCKDLEFSYCENTLPDCLTNAGVYADTTIAAFSNCLQDLPDANVDGGCTAFANCLGTASN
jgi:hypothetical protein